MILFVAIPVLMAIIAMTVCHNYRLGLKDGNQLSDTEKRILDICCLYRQGRYTASEVGVMVDEIMGGRE